MVPVQSSDSGEDGFQALHQGQQHPLSLQPQQTPECFIVTWKQLLSGRNVNTIDNGQASWLDLTSFSCHKEYSCI